MELASNPTELTSHTSSDLPGVVLTEADKKLDDVYGDHVYQNHGAHLDGGVNNDAVWQGYWRQLIGYPGQKYDVPKGSVGKGFLSTLTGLLADTKSRKCNSEKFLVFQMIILQCTRDVK